MFALKSAIESLFGSIVGFIVVEAGIVTLGLRSQKSVPFSHFAYRTLDSKSEFWFNSHLNDSKLSQSNRFPYKTIPFWISFLKNCPNSDSSINLVIFRAILKSQSLRIVLKIMKN